MRSIYASLRFYLHVCGLKFDFHFLFIIQSTFYKDADLTSSKSIWNLFNNFSKMYASLSHYVDPNNKKLFYIEPPSLKLIPWYINQFLVLGTGIGSCNMLILRQFFYQDGAIPLLNLMVLMTMAGVGGFFYCVGITYVFYGKDFHHVWNELANRG